MIWEEILSIARRNCRQMVLHLQLKNNMLNSNSASDWNGSHFMRLETKSRKYWKASGNSLPKYRCFQFRSNLSMRRKKADLLLFISKTTTLKCFSKENTGCIISEHLRRLLYLDLFGNQFVSTLAYNWLRPVWCDSRRQQIWTQKPLHDKKLFHHRVEEPGAQ